MLEILQAETEDEVTAARDMFREYEHWLDMDLCFQGFEAELSSLPGKYTAPAGRLLLARANGHYAGCIAMRPLTNDICEMKRLFVRQAFQGRRVGVQLVAQLIKEARSIGYEKMRLDTFPPRMDKALYIYEAAGFYPITAYYHNPHEGVLFMEMDLTR